jgi:membrane-associated phospholipid phosphatase
MPQPRSWTPARAALPVLLALALDPVAALAAPGRAEPVARMGHLIDAERSLGAFFEPSVHAWVAARPLLLHALEVTYVAVHVPLTLAVLAWVWVRRRPAFPFARNAFVAAQTLCGIVYLVAPTAPPRMVRGLGYSAAPGPGDHGLGRLVQSPYAAMPSAHTAFALVTAGILFALARSRRARVLALLYPAAVLGEILATGNHIWLDAVGGATAAGLAFTLAHRLRARSASRPREPAAEPAMA